MTTHTDSENKITAKEFRIILMCVAVTIGQFFAIDMYIPSLPWMEKSLGVTQFTVQLTIAFYALGTGFSALFSGPWSDKIGRKPVIQAGLATLLFGSLICLFSINGTMLLIGRTIQGIGAGFCISPNRAVLSDVFSAKKIAIVGAYFGTLMSASPIIAPIIGGYLEHYFNWRANFVVLAFCYALTLCVFHVAFTETISSKNSDSLSFLFIFKRYVYLLAQADFRVFAICGALAMSLGIAYATTASYIFQKTLHMTPVGFGWLGIYIGIGMVIGKLTTPILVKRYNMQAVFVSGLLLILLSGIVFVIIEHMGYLSIAIVTTIVMMTLIGQGYVTNNAFALGITPYRHMGGAANALISSGQMFIAFPVSALLSMATKHIAETSALANAYILIGGISLLFYVGYVASLKRNSMK